MLVLLTFFGDKNWVGDEVGTTPNTPQIGSVGGGVFGVFEGALDRPKRSFRMELTLLRVKESH